MKDVEKYIVYMILGEDDVVLYVGITKRKLARLTREHFTQSSHLDQTCYREAKLILYAECASKEDASVREEYLIKTRSPRFNDKHNRPAVFSFSISFKWQYLPVDKSRLDKPARRPPTKNVSLEIPSFEEVKQSFGAQFSFDCTPARIEGPRPGLIWLDGKKLGTIVEAAWADSGLPGRLRGTGASFACEALARRDWTVHIECAPSRDDALLWIPRAHAEGGLANRVPWLSARDDSAVREELSRSARLWHLETGQQILIGTLATELAASMHLYNSRDNYFLSLAYLREVLQTGTVVENRYVILDCNLQSGLLHDWFVHQSLAVGYKTWLCGVEIKPGQKVPSTVSRGGKRDEEQSRWYREAYFAGRNEARRLSQTVWVYSASDIRELQAALDVELTRLLKGATDVCYHEKPHPFSDSWDTGANANLASPTPPLPN